MANQNEIQQRCAFLGGRLRDLAREASRVGFAAGSFLRPEEIALLRSEAKTVAAEARLSLCFLGGYATAERRVPLFFDAEVYPYSGEDEVLGSEVLSSLCGITVLEVRAVGRSCDRQQVETSPLSHRALLGSLLSLGITRDVLGDLIPYGEEGSFAVVAKDSIAPYLMENLTRVGRVPVNCVELALPFSFLPDLPSELLTDTVASLRIDCLLAALLRQSAASHGRCGVQSSPCQSARYALSRRRPHYGASPRPF